MWLLPHGPGMNRVFSIVIQVNPKTWDINYNQKPIKHNQVFSIVIQVNPKTLDINYNQKQLKNKNTWTKLTSKNLGW